MGCKMNYLLGLDNGGTVIKAAVFDEDGKQIAVASQRVGLITPKAGYTERNMTELWEANAAAVRDAIKKAEIDGGEIIGVAVSGHGKGLYLLGHSGELIYNGIVSTDNRAELIELKFREEGIEEQSAKTNYQNVLACQPVCLLRWLKENDPTVYEKIGTVFSVKDYVRYRLTGEIGCEMTDVSGSNLLNLKTGSYDKQLLELFGIGEIWGALPPVKYSGEICGYVTEECAAQTGLKAGTPVAGGMFDIDACALGVGIVDEDSICVIGGTWSINEYIAKGPVTDGSVAMNSYYCIPGYYLLEECSPTSAGNLEWFLQMFLGKEIDQFGGTNQQFFEWLNGLVAEAGIGSDILFFPFLFSSNEGAGKRAGLINLTAAATKGEIIRAVYEGIVFSHKRHLDRLLKSRNAPRAIRLAGGVANSSVWAQMFADVIGLPVETMPERENGCFGAAIAAGVACGLYGDYKQGVKKAVQVSQVYLPDESKKEIYQKKYAAYVEAVEKR